MLVSTLLCLEAVASEVLLGLCCLEAFAWKLSSSFEGRVVWNIELIESFAWPLWLRRECSDSSAQMLLLGRSCSEVLAFWFAKTGFDVFGELLGYLA